MSIAIHRCQAYRSLVCVILLSVRHVILSSFIFFLRLCLHDSRVEIRVVFTRGGLESSVKNSTSRFPTTRIIFEKGSCKVHDEPFQPGLNCLHAFFCFFKPGLKSQPGLLTRVEISTQVVM